MENKEKTIILLLSCLLTFTYAQQNLCNDAKAKGFKWAADPSDCTRYIYCERDSANTDDKTNIKAVYYLQCDQSSPNKYFKDDQCLTTNAHCAEALSLCPKTGQQDIKIANNLDPTCKQNRYCRLPGMPMNQCVDVDPNIYQFDRNTGTCVDNTDGTFLPNCSSTAIGDPCKELVDTNFVGFIGSTTPVADFASGTNPVTECGAYYFCYEQQTYDSGTCPCNEIFDSATNPCKVEATPACFPCTGQFFEEKYRTLF